MNAGGLIERLEKATEGSRILDAELYQHVKPRWETSRGYWRWRGTLKKNERVDPSPWLLANAPHYTTSIDAAKSLLPPDDLLAAWHVGYAYNGGPYDARVFIINDVGQVDITVTHEHSEVIALVIACLKARGIE